MRSDRHPVTVGLLYLATFGPIGTFIAVVLAVIIDAIFIPLRWCEGEGVVRVGGVA